MLQNSFEGCVDVVGVLVPKKAQNDDGLVEFDTTQLGLSFLSQLDVLPVKAETRFGYDVRNEHFYFVVGLASGPTIQIPFGAGRLKDFAGIVSYNMVVERDEMKKLLIPSYDNITSYIANMNVDRKGAKTFLPASAHTESCSNSVRFAICISGSRAARLWMRGRAVSPLNIGVQITGEDPFTYVGKSVILYTTEALLFLLHVFDMQGAHGSCWGRFRL